MADDRGNAEEHRERGRDRYDPAAVDRTFALVRWFHENRLSTPLYYFAAALFVPGYQLLLHGLNRTRIIGRDRLPPPGQGFFLLSNHMSNLDGQALAVATLPRTYWFPSKASFYSSLARGLGYMVATGFKSFPVRRGERDERAIELMKDLLSRGESILLFPAGTRSRSQGDLGRGRPGVGKVIHDVRPVVVPAYLDGFDRILKPGSALPRTGQEAAMIFGHPLNLDDLFAAPSGRETSQAIVDRVMDAIGALRDELGSTPR